MQRIFKKLIRTINTAYDRINWSIEDGHILEMDTIEVLINKISFKELYWASFKIDQRTRGLFGK